MEWIGGRVVFDCLNLLSIFNDDYSALYNY